MRIYNSLSNKIEEFIPINEGKINMYVCGPTVYSYAHVGNMRPVIIFDTVYRYFKYLGYDVKYASNFTDVDDKIIKAAIELNVSEKEITEKFIKIYLEDSKNLNCMDIDYRPKVTDTMDEIISFIDLLIKKDYAYKSGDDVYFRVDKVKDYGILSNQNINDLESGKRIEVDNNKENPFDFVLWKKTNEGITWESPFGEGRPGWHTECVVMIRKLFGNNIDIHGGGIDLKFPHHENEIAQANAAFGGTLANYWMHNGHLLVNGEKMSKSLGNFILAKDLRNKYDGNIVRLGMLSTNYRLPLNLTDDLFSESKITSDKIYNVLKQANLYLKVNNFEVINILKDENINKIMDDDFNTPNLITYLLDLVKELNNSLRNKSEDISQLFSKINLVNSVLGLDYSLKELNVEEINLYKEWLNFREKKDFVNADILRNILIEKSIL